MVSVEEAFRIIQLQLVKPSVEQVDITHSVGRIIAETLLADRDFPPFNRVMMDGIALHSGSFQGHGSEFNIDQVQPAGSPQVTLTHLHHAIEVMTGSVLPAGADTVIRYEDVEIRNGKAKVLLDKISAGTNIHRQGSDARQNEVLLHPGHKLSPAEVALLASVGKERVSVFGFPTTAVITTGDEVVDITAIPLPHQIRKSNSYALVSAMKEMGWNPNSFHVIDNKEVIKNELEKILQDHDVLILSGGVSKGKYDFIPHVLEELEIKKLFQEVSQRPGRPFWFGASGDETKTVFALPGNPVSTFLCFYKYVKPWILKCMGISNKPVLAILAAAVEFKPTLTYFLQVRIRQDDGKLLAVPVMGGGSGDFVNLKDVDGFLELPREKSAFKTGETYPFISFRN